MPEPQNHSSPSTSGAVRPRRRGVDPARRSLLIATIMVILGSFMPWVDTAAGAISGARGPGLWTFYAAMLGLAGGLSPSKRIAGVQAAIFGAVAITLPLWQLIHLIRLVRFEGWLPGPGLVLVFGGGVLAASAAWRLLSPPGEGTD